MRRRLARFGRIRWTRKRGVIAVVVGVVIIAVVAVCVTVPPVTRIFGQGDTSTDRSCIPTPSAQPLGVAAGSGLSSLSDADLARTLDATVDGGMRWIRFDFMWSAIEPRPGQLDWSSTDRVVTAAQSRGLTILGIIDTTPPWARPSAAADQEFALPSDPAQFGAFAGLAAARYRDSVANWEVWNEPNIAKFSAPAPDVGRYAAMLSAASAAIRSAGPEGVTVVSAGLSPAVDGPDSIAPATFLTELYRRGDRSSWDAVGIHPYSYPYLPQDKSTAAFNTFLMLPALYAIMQRSGDGAKKLWVTEYGAPTGGSTSQRVTEKFQGDSIFAAIMATRSQAHFGPFFVYSLRDTGTDTSDAEMNFGILRNDFTPKPAYRELQRAADCR